MSADNGIYILKGKNGSKVAYSHNIEDINYEPNKGNFNTRIIEEKFGKSELYSNYEKAYKDAVFLEKEIGWTEYGICTIEYPFDF